MPQGKGTYGSKMGRPPKKKKGSKKNSTISAKSYANMKAGFPKKKKKKK